MNRDYTYLVRTLESWNFTLSDKQINQLDLFYDLLIEKNKVMNLTAITDFDEVLVKHFVDSISICSVLPSNIENICDLGLSKDFLHMTPKTQAIKGKPDKLYFIKI